MRALLFLLFVFAPNAWAAPPDSLPEGGSGTVAVVMDGDSFRLKNGGADVRMLAIQAPKLPKGRKGFKAWPMSSEAQDALEALMRGHTVTLRLGQNPRDRNGRILAHVVRDDGLWLQEALVRDGWARVYTFPDNRDFAAELLKAESQARAAKRGLWRDDTYAVRAATPEKLAADVGTFQIIEGKVVDTAKVKGRVFLNFGDDFKTDVTVVIPPDVVPMFAKAKLDPLSFKDKTIRVRGYVRSYNGPSIDISHPEQVEVLP
jgi:endonuclease YncB( thermonuclease family)